MPKIGECPNRDAIAKVMNEMTPERRLMLNNVFSKMTKTDEPLQPLMRQMNFGGDYDFDINRNQVDLNGTFSKNDLLRIAMVLE